MNKKDFKSHRCDGLLKSECFIRKYDNQLNNKWCLYTLYYNIDTEYVCPEPISEIVYCPWCGELLSSK